MTITTNHAIGDKVCYLANNGVIKFSEVAEIHTASALKNSAVPASGVMTSVSYRLKDAVGVSRTESQVYKSERELLDSLGSPAKNISESKK